MSIESVMPSNHLIFCCPLLIPPSIFPSIRLFSSESDLCIRWPKYWSFSFSISPSNEYSGLISFRMDWLDLLAVRVSTASGGTGLGGRVRWRSWWTVLSLLTVRPLRGRTWQSRESERGKMMDPSSIYLTCLCTHAQFMVCFIFL